MRFSLASSQPALNRLHQRPFPAGMGRFTVRTMRVYRLDHLVLTVADLERTCHFYETALGMERRCFGEGRVALHYGDQKLNLHPAAAPLAPHAAAPTRGSADLCFLTETPIAAVRDHLAGIGIPIETGPVERSGANGPILSVYVRDPDGNLVEIASTASAW